jgi:protein phosphatase
MKSKYTYRSTAETDPGLRKTVNEDYFLEHPQPQVDKEALQHLGHLYAVADGVSGQAGGDIASKIAVDTLRMYYVLPQVTISPEDRLRNVFLEAHRRIEEYAQHYPEYHGMGTTLTSIVLRDGVLYYGHVGDSRLYLIRSETQQIKQLTEDHSLVAKFVREGKLTPEEAAEEDTNVLEQALGCVPKIHVDVGEYTELQRGDLLLLCSDGLSDLVSDAKIRDIVLSAPSLDDACHRLVMKANQNGGKDNITVVLVAVEKESQEV